MLPELRERIEQRESVLNRVIELLITHLQLERSSDELDPDTPLFGSGLCLDSLDAVEVAVVLESEFGVMLDADQDDSLFAMRTINSLVDVVLESRGELVDGH